MQRPDLSQFLTVQQVAELLNIKVSTVRAWLAQRRLPVFHCGRSVRVPSEAVYEYIRRNTIPARPRR